MTEEMHTVLLVEDSADHALLMGECLEEAGYHVVRAGTGGEALAALKAARPDVAVLDYSLPGEDGLAVLEKIRSAGDMVPVVMVTSQGSEQVAVAAMKGGAYDYVVKGGDYLQRLPIVAGRAIEAQQLVIDRQRAEEALAHERDLLHALMDNMPDWIFFKDRGSRFTRINTAPARLLGLADPQAAVGRTDFDFFSPEQAQRFYDEEQRIMESGHPVIAREWQVSSTEGETFWVSETKVPLLDETGQVTGLVGISRDITERKRSEEALRLRTEQLAVLYQIGQDITSSLDLDETLRRIAEDTRRLTGARRSRILLVNPQARQVLKDVICGYPPEEKGMYDYELLEQGISGWVIREKRSTLVPDVLADERSVGRDRATSARRGTRSVAVAPLIARAKVIGTLTAVNMREDPVFAPEHMSLVEQLAAQASIAIQNAQLYAETRAQSRRLAQALAASESLHRHLGLEETLEGIARGVVRALGFRRAVVNVREPGGDSVWARAVAGLEGADREKLLGAIYRWSDFQSLMQECFRVSRSYLIRQGQLDWQRQFPGVVLVADVDDRGPGYWRPEDMLLVPLWGSDGEPVGLLSVDEPLDGRVPDLNTVRALEIFANQAAIAIENARLYQQVQQRAEELEAAYHQVQRAQEALIKAERLAAMSQIGVTVRHEINNPLTAVLGNAQWLLATDRTLSPESREALQEIETAATRIRNVVRKLDEIEDRPVPYLGETMMIDIRGGS